MNVATVQKQRGSDDCGVFAIAFALHAALGHCLEKMKFDQATMRDHLLKCYTTRNFTPFPTKKVKRARHTLIMNIDVFCSCQMPDTYGIWCSVVFANSGFTSSVLASTLFHQVQKNGIVHSVHKSWCVNELYLSIYRPFSCVM